MSIGSGGGAGPDDGRGAPTRDAPIAMAPDAFREAGHALVDRVADFLGSLRDRPVTPGESPETVRTVLDAGAPLPETGSDPAALLASTAEMLMDHSLLNGHPRFFGYITASAAPIGILADLLAAAVNPNTGGWTLSPMATEVEAQAVRWVAELMGYPAGDGHFTSGGTVANIAGAVAARVHAADRDGRDLRADGVGRETLAIYASQETHTWVQKAADLMGLGTAAIRWIPTDDGLGVDTAALRRILARDREQGVRPMMVVGTAGSVSTGAVDALDELAGICREHEVWFHVDGAYGGFATGMPGAPPALEGLRLADSVAVDPHKWLYAPLEAGCVLVRDPDALRAAFSYHPPYYHFDTEVTNFFDHGLQNSRGFRALKVWLALRHAGRAGYERMIGDDIALSERLHAALAAEPEIEAITQGLSINTFRYVPPELREVIGTEAVEEHLDALNTELLERIQQSGEAFVSNAVVRGRFALRSCIVNYNTEATDVDALPELVVRLGRSVHAELKDA